MKKMLTAAVVALMMLGTFGLAQAQDEEKAPLFSFDVAVAAGYGSKFAEEDETFEQDSQYGTAHVDILGIDLFDTTSGVGMEVQFGGELEYTVWSLNRATVPGTGDRVYAGSDLKLIQSADDGGAEGDFDLRLVTGYRLAEVGPGQLRFELYFIEENRPIAFALLFGF
jgi:opacity protein-like surface antigen